MNFNWKPFIALAAVILVLFVITFAFFAFFGAGGWSNGPWVMGPWMMGFFWIFPIFGLLIFLTVMFFFMSMIFDRGGGPTDWMRRGGPWGADHQRSSDMARLRCPSCDSSVEPDWKVCPHCGTNLKE